MDTRGNIFSIFNGYTRFKDLEYDNKTSNKPLKVDNMESIEPVTTVSYDKNDEHDRLNETLKINKKLIKNDTNFEDLKDKIVNLEKQLTTIQLALVEEYERNLAFKDVIMQLYRGDMPTIIKLSDLELATVYADLIRKGIKNISDIPDNKDLRAIINNILRQD